MHHWFVVMCFASNRSKKLHTVHYAESQSQAVMQAFSYWSTRVDQKLKLF